MQLPPPPLICVFSHSLRNIHRSAQSNLEWNESIQNQSYSKYTIEKFIRKKKFSQTPDLKISAYNINQLIS